MNQHSKHYLTRSWISQSLVNVFWTSAVNKRLTSWIKLTGMANFGMIRVSSLQVQRFRLTNLNGHNGYGRFGGFSTKY